MRRSWASRGLLLALVSIVSAGPGCGPSVALDDDAGVSSSSGDSSPTSVTNTTTSTTNATVPGTTVPPPDPDGSTTNDSVDSSPMFLDGFDDASIEPFECDLFLQDCPKGDKCMPWASDGGGVWNATRCSPIDPGADGVGEPCTVEGGPTSGLDSCVFGAMCWDVSLENLEGTCTAICSGTADDPVCLDPETSCATEARTGLALCLLYCYPLDQDCPAGQGCYPVSDPAEHFACVPDHSGDVGAAGDACEYLNECDPGQFCASPEMVPDCVEVGCCSPFCDLSDPMSTCPPGQECVPWWDPLRDPWGDPTGACTVPP